MSLCCDFLLAVVLSTSAELGEVIKTTRAMIDMFSKAKAAKLLRELVGNFSDIKQTTGIEVSH